MRRVRRQSGERHLVRTPVSLGLLAVDRTRPGPTLGAAQHDQRPGGRSTGRFAFPLRARGHLNRADLVERAVQRRRHLFVHHRRVRALDEDRPVAQPDQQALELRRRDARQHRGVGDLEAVEVEDRQDRAVARRIQELVRVPRGGERTGFGFAVTDHAGDDEVGVVERRAVGVRKRVAQLAAFVDRTRGLGRHVTRDATGERELLEQPPQALGVARDLGIDLAVGPLEIHVGDHPRTAVPGTADIEHVEVALHDHPVEVGVDEVQARRGAPVTEQSRLDVAKLERLAQERIVEQVDLAHRQIVGRPPIGVEECELASHGDLPRFARSLAVETAPGLLGDPALLVDRHDEDVHGGFGAGDPSRCPLARPTAVRLADASKRRPHHSIPEQIRSRISAAFSPIPPPKITASAPPSTAR